MVQITENVFTKPFPLLYFVTAECLGQNLINRLFDKQMVKCDGCCEWFHRMCERIPEKPFNEKYVKWYCYKCLLLEKA